MTPPLSLKRSRKVKRREDLYSKLEKKMRNTVLEVRGFQVMVFSKRPITFGPIFVIQVFSSV